MGAMDPPSFESVALLVGHHVMYYVGVVLDASTTHAYSGGTTQVHLPFASRDQHTAHDPTTDHATDHRANTELE